MRLLLCLPLCLLLAPVYPQAPLTGEAPAPARAARDKALPMPGGGDAVAFLEMCMARFDSSNIEGYSLRLRKQERIEELLHPVEQVEVYHRHKPHSVFFRWHQGARRAQRALYVEGEN